MFNCSECLIVSHNVQSFVGSLDCSLGRKFEIQKSLTFNPSRTFQGMHTHTRAYTKQNLNKGKTSIKQEKNHALGEGFNSLEVRDPKTLQISFLLLLLLSLYLSLSLSLSLSIYLSIYLSLSL